MDISNSKWPMHYRWHWHYEEEDHVMIRNVNRETWPKQYWLEVMVNTTLMMIERALSLILANNLAIQLQVHFELTNYKSLLSRQTTNPFWADKLQVPFDMTEYKSLLIWQTSSLFWHDRIQVVFELTNYKSLLTWQTASPFSHDRLQVPFVMTVYKLLYHTQVSQHDTTSPFWHDSLQVTLLYKNILAWHYKSLLSWQTTFCPIGLHNQF